MRFAFIEAWKEQWPVEFLCRVMRVTSRGFRAWRVRLMSQRQRPSRTLLRNTLPADGRYGDLGPYPRTAPPESSKLWAAPHDGKVAGTGRESWTSPGWVAPLGRLGMN